MVRIQSSVRLPKTLLPKFFTSPQAMETFTFFSCESQNAVRMPLVTTVRRSKSSKKGTTQPTVLLESIKIVAWSLSSTEAAAATRFLRG